jgi:hypothetical protein
MAQNKNSCRSKCLLSGSSGRGRFLFNRIVAE